MHLVRRVTVPATQRYLEYVDGAHRRTLEPGRHRRPRRATYRSVSLLQRLDTLAPQEVLTEDGVTAKVSAVVRWNVADARAFAEAAEDAFAVVYLAVQLALREALLDVEAEAVVREARLLLGEPLTEAARAAASAVGIAVAEVVVKDVVLPYELRAAYAEVVTSRARGQAQLEAARAETAALRSLANGAKLLDDHPALARLRLVQALPMGSTLELRTPGER
mgnify:CR=1 FL=1